MHFFQVSFSMATNEPGIAARKRNCARAKKGQFNSKWQRTTHFYTTVSTYNIDQIWKNEFVTLQMHKHFVDVTVGKKSDVQ